MLILLLGSMMSSAEMSFDDLLTLQKEEEGVESTNSEELKQNVKGQDLNIPEEATATEVSASKVGSQMTEAKMENQASVSAKKKRKNKKNKSKVEPAANDVGPFSPLSTPETTPKTTKSDIITPSEIITTKEPEEIKIPSPLISAAPAVQYPNSVLRKTFTAPLPIRTSSMPIIRPVRQPETPPSLTAKGFSTAYRNSRTVC